MTTVGALYFFFLWPFFLLYLVLDWLWRMLLANSVLIGVLCLVAAVLSALALFIPARRMSRSKRTWRGVIGWLLMIFAGIATLVFAGLSVAAFVAGVVF